MNLWFVTPISVVQSGFMIATKAAIPTAPMAAVSQP
jgi:hypothetical protein